VSGGLLTGHQTAEPEVNGLVRRSTDLHAATRTDATAASRAESGDLISYQRWKSIPGDRRQGGEHERAFRFAYGYVCR
jgi:hypothetical protein